MIRFNSFTFQIWLPFAFALLIIISVAALYYPSKQEAYYIQNKKAQTLELSKTVAMNYELVFTLADSDPNIVFSSLKTILDFAQKDHDIAFISIFDDDEYFSHRPNNIAVNEIIKWDSIKYIYQTSSFSYLDELGDKRSGFVKIAVSRSSIQDEISKNNRPIYFLLLGLTIFFLIAFYVLARWISKPIISVTNATLALSNQDFTGELPESNSKDEIGLLVNAIRGLRVKLLDQKSIDAQVVDKLETLVEERTLDLQQTQSEFVLAQKNAKFGIIRYYFNNDAWKSSDEFDLILGVDESVIKNMDGLSRLFVSHEKMTLQDVLPQMIENQDRFFSSDLKLKRLSDGETLVLAQVWELRYAEGNPIELIGSIQDITAKSTLQEELERLSLVAKKTTNLVLITDAKENITWVNDAAIEMTGYSREEIIGNTPRMFQFEKTDPEAKKKIRNALNEGRIISELEIQNRSKDGLEYWLTINIIPIKDENNDITGYIAVESDITELKRQVELRLENEMRYSHLLDKSSEMIQSLDAKGCITYANKAWLLNMNYESLDEVLGKHILSFFSDNTIKEFAEVMPELMKGNTVENLQCEFIAKDFNQIDITGRSQPIMENGQFVGSQGFFFNVTEVRKVKIQLDQMAKFKEIMLEITTEYINTPVSEIDSVINASLLEIAKFSSADRAYVFKYDYENETCSITHEWAAQGIRSQINELTSMPFSDVPYSMNKHVKGEFVEFPDVSKVKDKRIQDVLTDEGIQSLISIPMMDNDKAIGFIGFDIMKTKRAFTIDEKNLLRIYSQMLVNVFARKGYIEELQRTKAELAGINLSLEKKVLENTKKNMDLTRSILEQEKLVTIGEISSGIAHDLNTPLGTIRVGADNVNFILSSLFNGSICDFTKEELSHILNHVEKNRIEMYVGGLQMRKEKEQMIEYLNGSFKGDVPAELDEISGLLVKCRFNPTNEDDIFMILSKPFAKEYLQIMNQLQMAMAQLETIRKSSDKAVRVVQDMRAFIKGESAVEQKLINLRENISTVLGVFNYEISLHVNLVFEVDESIEFMGYDIKLFQLWSNIVKNGLEAMSDQKDKYLGIFAERSDTQLKIVFENNGPKIPEEIADTIFNKFYTTKGMKSGSGLGLSIVKNVLKEHKANIILESNESLTKFIITFEL